MLALMVSSERCATISMEALEVSLLFQEAGRCSTLRLKEEGLKTRASASVCLLITLRLASGQGLVKIHSVQETLVERTHHQ